MQPSEPSSSGCFQLCPYLGFPDSIPYTAFLGHPTVLPPVLPLLLILPFSREMLPHPVRPPAAFASFSVHVAGLFLSLEKVILENQPVFLDISPELCLGEFFQADP